MAAAIPCAKTRRMRARPAPVGQRSARLPCRSPLLPIGLARLLLAGRSVSGPRAPTPQDLQLDRPYRVPAQTRQTARRRVTVSSTAPSKYLDAGAGERY